MSSLEADLASALDICRLFRRVIRGVLDDSPQLLVHPHARRRAGIDGETV
jgi:hypothetical protein